MSTVTSLNPYSFAFNGFIFGGANSPYQILSVDGLEALPALRVQDSDRGYQDGMFSGRDFLAGRTITITIQIMSGNSQTAQANYNLLQNALQPQQSGTTPLQFQLAPGDNFNFVNCRIRRAMATVDPDYTYGKIKAQYEFFCPDPRYYDYVTNTASMAVTQPLGRTYNRTYNLTFGGGSQTQTAIVQNNGNTTTYPIITIYGPVTNPVVGSLTSSQALSLNYTMAQSDIFSIDLLNKTILLNGNPARNLLLGSSQWFAAPPGTNLFYFTGMPGTTVIGQTNATVQWNNAYSS
jgi:phage-related protein